MLTALLASTVIFVIRRLIELSNSSRASLLSDLLNLLLFIYVWNLLIIQLDTVKEIQTIGNAINIGTAIILILGLTRIGKHIFAGITALMIMLAPFAVFTFFHAASGIWVGSVGAATHSELNVSASVPVSTQRLNGRVVWVIFDEFDFRIPFELKAVELPEFDRLRSEALFANNAVSPARYTLEAIPSLLTGSEVNEATVTGPSNLRLENSDGDHSDLRSSDTIFASVRRQNGNSGVVGYYHPYCRVFKSDLATCEWENNVFNENPPFEPQASIANAVSRDLQNLLAPVLFLVAPKLHYAHGNAERRLEKIRSAHSLRSERIGRMVADPDLDLVFLHLPYPHPPAHWDDEKGDFVLERRDYAENLKLADDVLGSIRRALERSGQWDSTAVLISSDHPLRVDLWKDDTCCLTPNDRVLTREVEAGRIPFILKMPGAGKAVEYDRHFNTVVSRDLILSILKGDTRTVYDAIKWLEAR